MSGLSHYWLRFGLVLMGSYFFICDVIIAALIGRMIEERGHKRSIIVQASSLFIGMVLSFGGGYATHDLINYSNLATEYNLRVLNRVDNRIMFQQENRQHEPVGRSFVHTFCTDTVTPQVERGNFVTLLVTVRKNMDGTECESLEDSKTGFVVERGNNLQPVVYIADYMKGGNEYGEWR